MLFSIVDGISLACQSPFEGGGEVVWEEGELGYYKHNMKDK